MWWGCVGLGFGVEGLLVRFVRTRGGLFDEEAIVLDMTRVGLKLGCDNLDSA